MRKVTTDGMRLSGTGMKLAIVGSTSLKGSVLPPAIIRNRLEKLKPSVVISGGAEGIDQLAAHIARKMGIEVVEHLPTVRRWEGPGGFKERNMKIAEECDVLIAIRSKYSKTYGSGWTADYTEKLGKMVERIILGSWLENHPERV